MKEYEKEIKVGDVVKYTSEFLRSTGQHSGPVPSMEGTVLSVVAKVNWGDHSSRTMASNLRPKKQDEWFENFTKTHPGRKEIHIPPRKLREVKELDGVATLVRKLLPNNPHPETLTMEEAFARIIRVEYLAIEKSRVETKIMSLCTRTGDDTWAFTDMFENLILALSEEQRLMLTGPGTREYKEPDKSIPGEAYVFMKCNDVMIAAGYEGALKVHIDRTENPVEAVVSRNGDTLAVFFFAGSRLERIEFA